MQFRPDPRVYRSQQGLEAENLGLAVWLRGPPSLFLITVPKPKNTYQKKPGKNETTERVRKCSKISVR